VYLAIGDRFGCLDDPDTDEAPAWPLDGSGAQCLAVDPGDVHTVYAGCRGRLPDAHARRPAQLG
jgi:hypothetical protein